MLYTFAFKKRSGFFFSKAHLQHTTSILYQSEGGKRGLMSCLLRLTCLYEQQEIPLDISRLWNAVILPFLLLLNIEIIGANFWAKLIDTRYSKSIHTQKLSKCNNTPPRLSIKLTIIMESVSNWNRIGVDWIFLPIDRSEQIIKMHACLNYIFYREW